ncbi:MAG: carboxylating nicotinate-nucleotide diphosphorylase [Marinilabiliaceae bacterium]|jgi:nicotinate-nucleotide pyrophosphorylase (carboxylating)|nr:carboxylating nicotinate-nucleotide diphosphorylase [Marinilabiliaceae bacterium]
MIREVINKLIARAFEEDIGDGDHTSLSCIPPASEGKAELLVKDNGIIAGLEVAEMVFKYADPGLSVNCFLRDGDRVKKGDIAFEVQGKQQSLLRAERLVLNILQRMSGIATETRRYADELKDFKTRVLDTRKTTPGFRILEKEAVRIGGGVNHRMGLYDMIMLKDNHIDFAGGIKEAISRARSYLAKTGKDLKIEIEARSMEEVREILSIGGVDRIMLDNFTPSQTLEAVNLIRGRFETESSGGITFDTLREYAACGVDFISVGALTHQVKSLDLSLKAVK